MPFGGHQQIAKGFASRVPFIHLLPENIYAKLLSLLIISLANRLLIRTFAHDFMNMWIDLGCLQPQKKMLKEKTCMAYAHRTFTHSALFLSPYITN